MFKSKSSFFEEDIAKATHENNIAEDWALIMHICDNTINYDGGAKLCLKAILKRLYHQVPRVVLQTLTLLDACVKNCDRRFLLQVASSEFTDEVRKLLPKMHPSTANKLKELLQKWSLEEFKDDPELGIIPSLYYKLKSEGVEFPPVEDKKKGPALCTNPDGVSSQEEEEDIIKAIEISLKDTGRYVVPDEFKNIQLPSTTTQSLSEPMKVRALYDFDAAEDNELTIKAGEIVVVLDSSNANWWKGSNHRGEGFFPSNFVTKDLDAILEEPKVVETVAKTETNIEDDTVVELDEKKIEVVINWLNDTDPTADVSDPEDMLRLEKQCHNMAPLIEENLQSIDKRLAMLNSLNEKLMDAFSLFHSLSDSMPATNQPSKYIPTGTLNPHVVQFPHPQFSTLPPGTMLYTSMQPPVPPESNAASAVPQSNTQTPTPYPVTTAVQTSVQETPKSTTVSSVNTMTAHGVPENNQSNQAVINSNTSTMSIPVNPLYNFSMMGGYCIPSPAMPYPVQCDPNLQRPGFVQSPPSAANVMPFPYAVPPMRPYFPFPYYYVNSNSVQNVSHPASAGDPVQPVSQSPASSSAETEIKASTASIPVVSSYSNDLHSLTLTTSSSDISIPKQEIQSEQLSSDMTKKELVLNKSL